MSDLTHDAPPRRLQIVTADQRMAEPRGIKAAIFGKAGIGKTTLLMTLLSSTTLFVDLEAGDLAVEDWQGDSMRPRTWEDCQELACFIGGPNPALRDDQPYSAASYEKVRAKFGDARTPSPSPAASACNGAAASLRGSPTRPAALISVAPTVCMAAK